MKKVLFYVHSLNKGGAERVLLTLADYLKEKYEVVILTDIVDRSEYELPVGIQRTVLGECKGRFGISRLLRLKKIRHIYREINPDICIAFMISAAIRALQANVGRKMPVFVAVRSNPYYDYPLKNDRKRLNYWFQKADKIICQTKFQKEYFNELVQKKTVVIPNPISQEFVEQLREIGYSGETPKENRIVSVGRLYDYKNHKLLIRAFSKIAKKYDQYRLFIYGDGPYRQELEKEITTLSMQDKVILTGESDTVAKNIADADIFVLPSDTEGMPNALLEAMAMGLACIATDCPGGGPKSLINDGENGLLCKVGDVEDMTNKLLKLLDNRELRLKLGQNARSIKDTCSIDNILSQWIMLIEDNSNKTM